MGETLIALYEADLCTHPVDVVVNASNEDLRHIGGLAEALSRAAGPALQQECDELVRKLGNLQPGRAVITGAGKLPCKNVIHAVGPRWNEKESQKCTWLLKKTVKQCLQLAEIYNHRSIALPAISGGIFGFPLDVCTYTIVSSIKETLEEFQGNTRWKEIHLVGFAQDNIQAFRKAFKEVFPDSLPSYRSPHHASPVPRPRQSKRIKNFPVITTLEGLNIMLQIGSIEDTSIVVVSVGRDLQLDKGPLGRALLSKAGPMLQTGLLEEGGGRAEEGSVLKTKGYNLACSVVLHAVVPAWSQKNTPSKVRGFLFAWICLGFIMCVSKAILNGAGKAVEDECAVARQTGNNYVITQGGNLPCKNIIHFVAQDDIKSLVSQVLQECELQQYTSVTFPAIGTGLLLPPTWDPMENERVKIVELKPDSKEYKDVQEKFLQTCQSFKIEKIERVQSQYLWKSYQIKKCEMDKKNGDRNNERLLFHGTSQESLTFINDHGFNRSYAGMHAANFGNGTYFAVNANYSAHDIYSKPDANGKKYMYLARVLVGEYSLGKKGSVTPARKNVNNSVDLFDSSTDNMNQPSMFIIFNDIQAYPEYLITFTK
uniref:Poly [ADP-ribose] polymerase n=1 Tax=Catharus ustulatus TaxID=91951 RepID=A0A8C3TNA9_CATUS